MRMWLLGLVALVAGGSEAPFGSEGPRVQGLAEALKRSLSQATCRQRGGGEEWRLALGEACRVLLRLARDDAGFSHLLERRIGKDCLAKKQETEKEKEEDKETKKEKEEDEEMKEDEEDGETKEKEEKETKEKEKTKETKEARDGEKRRRLVVCSYNTWNFSPPYARRIEQMARLLVEQECDVVALQEMRLRWRKGERAVQMVEDLIKAQPQAFGTFSLVFVPAMSYPESNGRNVEMEGLAILSRYPIGHVDSKQLSNEGRRDPEDFHRRILIRVPIAVPFFSQPLQMFNTHASLSAHARARNGKEMVRHLAAVQGPVILAGDLNSNASDPLVQMLLEEAQLEDSFAAIPDEATFPAWRPSKRIDFVLTRHLRIVSRNVFGGGQNKTLSASDHLGLRVCVEPIATESKRDEL